jgi:hypothetical protein
MRSIKLKGGSLSSTYYHGVIGEEFVRKSVNREVNREYAYVRWYSQLKKLQRYNTQYPNLFPKVLRAGIHDNTPYFDLEYLDGFQDIKTTLATKSLTEYEIANISEAVWKGFDQLHGIKHKSTVNIGKLYFVEEVQQKLNDALKVPEFEEFYDMGTHVYFGGIIHGLSNYMNELENYFSELKIAEEENIHGNPTLENIMYSFDENRVVFIDPYEESIIDTKYLDYAQVLQCSRSYYGHINDNQVEIEGGGVSHRIAIPKNFCSFSKHFESKIDHEQMLIDVLEATQFIRMLPFKCLAGNIDKAKYFYVHACQLLSKVFK